MEQFRQDVRENMEREAKQKVDGDVREQVLEGLIEKNPIDVPQALVHEEMHAMQHEAMQRLGIEDHDQAPPTGELQGAPPKSACALGFCCAR